MEALLPFVVFIWLNSVFITRINGNYINFSDLDEDVDQLVRLVRNAEQQGHVSLCHYGGRDLVAQLSSAVTDFSSRFYETAVVGMPDSISSPYSVFQALAMTYLGARRYTAHQMKRSMGLRRLGRCTHQAVHVAMTNMSDQHSVVLKIANRVYVRDSLQIRESYNANLQSNYGSSIAPLTLNGAERPEIPINAWVSNITEGLIPDLLAPGSISGNTAMLLVNAIYFKGNWKKAFDVSDTGDELFYKSSHQQTTVPMMHIRSKFRYASLNEEQAQVLMLPYTGDRFGMYIILPNNVDGLPAVESALPRILTNRLNSLYSAMVTLSLPKFKLETSFDLKDTLMSMGMVLPFSIRDADFSGITGNNDLFISSVVHKAVVEVTETGTEAAGGSAVVLSFRSVKQEEKVFTANHPFIFVIRDNVIKMPLFVGKYSGGS